MDILITLSILCTVIAGIVMPIILIVVWILRPIDRAGKFRQAPLRFSIADFLCLFLSIQIPLAAVYRFVPAEDKRPFWIFTITTWIVAPLIWFTCARALSKAGVHYWVHRSVFMGLVAPFVYYGIFPFVILTLGGVTRVVFAGHADLIAFDSRLVCVWLALAGSFFLCGLFTHWILRRARHRADASQDTNDALQE